MTRLLLSTCIIMAFICSALSAQKVDSTLNNLQNIPSKYVKVIDKKITQYSDRITSKTEKTLVRLSRWENKIHELLQKVSPETAGRLFGPNQQTFCTMLQKLRDGASVMDNYKAKYNEYRDKLTMDLKYMSEQKDNLNQKVVKPLAATAEKIDSLNVKADNAEAMEQFIKERKKELISNTIQYIGKSRYLSKINKEAWYYAETLKNYKAIFSDEAKTEEAVKTILGKIPACQTFFQKNSMLASLFPSGGNYGSAASMNGLQTRASIQNLIQTRIASSGPNATQLMQQNIQQAKGQLNQLRDKLLNNPYFGNGGGNMPDFKPNMEKTKTFKQRLELGTNMQSVKGNQYLPVASELGLSLGYRISEKSVTGIGLSYKMGWGKDIKHIHITHQGVGLRSFVDIKAKGNFWITGGFEYNYQRPFARIDNLIDPDAWQKSALIGISKKYKIGKKNSSLQLLYDLLYQQQVPQGQALKFRVGYTL